jgi:hypothetical protein
LKDEVGTQHAVVVPGYVLVVQLPVVVKVLVRVFIPDLSCSPELVSQNAPVFRVREEGFDFLQNRLYRFIEVSFFFPMNFGLSSLKHILGTSVL